MKACLKILVMKVTLPRVGGSPRIDMTPGMCAAPGSNGESPVRESTAAVLEPQPKSPWHAAAKATQGLCPAETLSAVSGDWHSTFPDSNACFQNERGEKILACHSNVVALDISGHFWGKYRFCYYIIIHQYCIYLYVFIYILYLFIYLFICSRLLQSCVFFFDMWMMYTTEIIRDDTGFPCFFLSSEAMLLWYYSKKSWQTDLLKTMGILSSVLTWS